MLEIILFHTTLIISQLAFYQCFFISRKLAESKSFTTFVIAKEILPDRTAQGAIAQLVEQRTENPCVPGSIPGGTTIDSVISQNPIEIQSFQWGFFYTPIRKFQPSSIWKWAQSENLGDCVKSLFFTLFTPSQPPLFAFSSPVTFASVVSILSN